MSANAPEPRIKIISTVEDTPEEQLALSGGSLFEEEPLQPGVPKKIVNAQTVCNVKNEKGKLCNGHIKQLLTGGEESEVHLRGDDVLFKCQSCGTLYMGPPLGHVRDPRKQQRFVEKELAMLLQAAGGTLPAIRKNEKGAYVLVEAAAPQHAPAAPAAKAGAQKTAAKPAAETEEQKKARAAAQAERLKALNAQLGPIPGAAGPPAGGETPEQKIARLQAVAAEAKRRKELAASEDFQTTPTAASTSGTDSSAQADLERPAAEAQAATGQASAVPMSSAAATAASPAAAEKKAARRYVPGTPLNRAAFDTGPVPGETQEQKIARLRTVVAAAKERAGKEE